MMPQVTARKIPLVIVTGLAGAGHSTALGALEDIGLESVDNLPISLIPNLLQHKAEAKTPLAIGIDSRTNDIFDAAGQQTLANILVDSAKGQWQPTLLFLTCAPAVLQRRFSVTRRRHPLTSKPLTSAHIADHIQQERALLAPIQALATVIIDTSDLSPTHLRERLRHQFRTMATTSGTPLPRITCMSFSYGKGVPAEADIVLDVRFLKNPHYEPALQPFTGMDDQVAAYIQQDPQFSTFQEQLYALLQTLLSGYQAEGKSYLTVAFGCTGGKHRSVFLAEQVGAWLQEQQFASMVYHRELENR